MNRLFQFFFLLLIVGSFSCKTKSNERMPIPKEDTHLGIHFLSKEEASTKIVTDRMDGFFESISIADMSIQLRKEGLSDDRSLVLREYKEMLQTEMKDFDSSEKEFMELTMSKAKAMMDKINPKLWPDKIELLKTKTNHYGPSVYYTREKGIVLPEDIFVEKSTEVQMPIMLHEIFHILSRYDDTFRNKMYKLIGFTHLDYSIKLPRQIEEQKLSNPDGMTMSYAVKLKDNNGKEVSALPLILSNKKRWEKSSPSFFSYLKFDLFPIIPHPDGGLTIAHGEQGVSTLSIEHNADFFRQIKDNTQYIIHPDEIMADNFMMAVIANNNGSFEGFSVEGKALLQEVLNILRDYNPK